MDYEWKCLPVQSFRIGDYSVAPVQPGHIEEIRVWRNAQKDVLRQMTDITPEQQVNYFSTRIWPAMGSKTPSDVLMSLFYCDELIGYGGLVHIAWEHKRAELSFLVSPARAEDPALYRRDHKYFLSLMKAMAFDHMGFHRLFTETYDVRPLHIANLEDSGFVREGVMREHVYIDGRAVDSIIHGCLSSYER